MSSLEMLQNLERTLNEKKQEQEQRIQEQVNQITDKLMETLIKTAENRLDHITDKLIKSAESRLKTLERLQRDALERSLRISEDSLRIARTYVQTLIESTKSLHTNTTAIQRLVQGMQHTQTPNTQSSKAKPKRKKRHQR